MSQQLQDKVIAITGAASGIGHATALECAARGAILALSDINLDVLTTTIKDMKAKHPDLKVTGHKVDVASSKSVDAWITEVVSHYGRIDGACNIAGVESKPGIASFQSIVNTTDEHWQFIQDINLTGCFYCVRAELRVMKKGGSIVNAASTAGLRGAPHLGAYVASKHGVVGLTKSAAKEGGPDGIRVNAVCPGPIDTPLLRRIANHEESSMKLFSTLGALPGIGTVENVAKSFCYLLGDDSSWTTGATLTVEGGSLA